MSNLFYNSGLKFSCQKCSHCCRAEPGFVYLSKVDLKSLLKHFALSKTEFVQKYCRWVPYFSGELVLSLLEKSNYDCILWQDGTCTAYDVRPIQCKTYPFWTYLLENKDVWASEAQNCPGINFGKLHSCFEIKQNLVEYELNQPIKQSEFEEFFV